MFINEVSILGQLYLQVDELIAEPIKRVSWAWGLFSEFSEIGLVTEP